MITREQDFREVRSLLGEPLPQRPAPHTIVSNMITAEQYLLNRMTGTGKPWTHNVLTVASVAGQAVYPLVPLTGPGFGKVLMVYRDLGDGTILPIPLTDFMSESHNPSYQFWVASASNETVVSGERVASFRNGNDVFLQIYPAPAAARTYSIVYATGSLDWTTFTWSDVPVLPEWSRYRQLYAALSTLSKCEWDGLDWNQNRAYRQELRQDLDREMARQEAELVPYLRNPHHEPSISEVGYFWEP